MGITSIAKNLKKTSIVIEMDDKTGGMRATENANETPSERMDRIKRERGVRLGLVR